MPEAASPETFQAAESFQGARPGWVFKVDKYGLGYYLDAVQANRSIWDEVIPKLPETWRETPHREEQLRVSEKQGCGLGLSHSEFGFVVDKVEDEPGQQLQPGEAIVAVEGRILAGLSAPQMQASFQKRRVDGARLYVVNLAQAQELSRRDPNIIEMWDPVKKHNYFFHKKTGKSAWTLEELQPPPSASSTSPEKRKAEAEKQAPIDIAHFMQHGFAKQKEPPKKKPKAKAKSDGEKDESDLAREERSRWRTWNEGGTGGYTEQFFERYKNCRAFEPKPKVDKRLKGSVGPGQGNEYMARWTGSKNSFN
mmetsp:Transcript_14129/g.26451  ORF Transcript_14129/g.26451 Transcript_14129/m.26451 type:complete len:309 (-) Transcript_14129:69-995(-)